MQHPHLEIPFSCTLCTLTCIPMISYQRFCLLTRLLFEARYISAIPIHLPTISSTLSSCLITELLVDQTNETLFSVLAGSLLLTHNVVDTQSGYHCIDRWETTDKLTWKSTAQLSPDTDTLNSLQISCNAILLLTFENGAIELRDRYAVSPSNT